MSPLPEARRPIDGVLLVQLKAVWVPVNVTAAVFAPAHTTWSTGSATVGVGCTVIVNVCGVPAHTPKTGVTMMVATRGVVPALIAVNEEMLPEPLEGSPID